MDEYHLALRLNLDSFEAHYCLGFALESMNKLASALEHYTYAAQLRAVPEMVYPRGTGAEAHLGCHPSASLKH